MKMCELKDGDCFYVPYGDWYGHVFEKDGVLYSHVNYTEMDFILRNSDTEVEICKPRRYNVEWKLKQLGFVDYHRKVLIINEHKYEVYTDYDATLGEIKFHVPYFQYVSYEENSFYTSGSFRSLRDIDNIYYTFETICNKLVEHNLIWEQKDI